MKLAVKSGAVIPLLLMLPNLAWMLFYSFDAGAKSNVPVALSAAENVARSAALVLPFFYSLNKKSVSSAVVWLGMAGALTVYYVAGAPLGGDPLPLLFGGRFPVRGARIVSP